MSHVYFEFFSTRGVNIYAVLGCTYICDAISVFWLRCVPVTVINFIASLI